MLPPPCQFNRPRLATFCPLRVSQEHLEMGVDAERTSCGIVSYVEIAMVRLGISVTKSHASVDVRTAFGQPTTQPICRPGGVVRFEQDLGIVELASDLLKA